MVDENVRRAAPRRNSRQLRQRRRVSLAGLCASNYHRAVTAAKKRSSPPPRQIQARWLAAILAIGFVGIGIYFWQRPATSKSPPFAKSSLTTFALESEKSAYAQYGGSASCQECHEEAYELWAGSHHGLAERLPSPALDETAFVPDQTFQHASQQTSVAKTNGDYVLRTPGLSGSNETFIAERVIGHNPLRQMLVPFPGGRWQATEACWDPRSNEWFNVYGLEDRKPGEWGHWTGRGMNWNTMCATCHNTRLRKNYDPTNDVFRTTMVERGVSCESCHGPMKDHNEWQYANKGKGLKDPTIKKLSREQMFHTCAACHSRRGEITGDPKPGDSFFDHHLLSIVDESNLFYPDGQIWDEDYEVTPFLGSKMFHKGVRCVDCHNFHSAKTKLPGNMLCLSCHGPGQTNAIVIDPVSHSRHKVFGFDTNGVMRDFDLGDYNPKTIKETGGECVNCHMPQTPYMQRHWRHDHGFTIPDPLLTKQHGIPNACNRCHQDKDVDWALKYVEEWYGDKMNRPYRQRAQTIARAKQGEDSARAALLQMLRHDEIDYWRAVAANMLENWVGEPEVHQALVQQLADTNALVRQQILQTLSPMATATPEIQSAVTARLKDDSRNVRVVAAQALSDRIPLDSLAATELQHMLRHNADQPAGQMQLGVFALGQGNNAAALQHFQTAAKWDPYSPGIRHELAIMLSRLNRPREALQQLQEAVRLAPQDAEFRFKLALAWNELGDATKALAELEATVKLDPRHARAGYNLGLARHAGGNSVGAIQALLAAESAAPQDAQIPYARATIHAQLGQLLEARQAAARALELNPRFAAAATLMRQLEQR
jgi:tetratricopeptide (TPR) repeat protein